MDWISSPAKEAPESSLACSAVEGFNQQSAVCSLEEGLTRIQPFFKNSNSQSVTKSFVVVVQSLSPV